MNIISEDYYSDGRTTTCVLTVQLDEELIKTFIGTARRAKVDKHSTELGRKIAQARAFEKLTMRLMRRASGLMRHQDHLYDQKINAKSKTYFRDEIRSFPANLITPSSTAG